MKVVYQIEYTHLSDSGSTLLNDIQLDVGDYHDKAPNGAGKRYIKFSHNEINYEFLDIPYILTTFNRDE